MTRPDLWWASNCKRDQRHNHVLTPPPGVSYGCGSTTTRTSTHESSPGHKGHAGEPGSEPTGRRGYLPLVSPSRAWRATTGRLAQFTSRRPATPTTKQGRASDRKERYMFHPPAIDRSIEATMDAIAVLDDAQRRYHLDSELRHQLALATSKLRVANRSLSGLSAR